MVDEVRGSGGGGGGGDGRGGDDSNGDDSSGGGRGDDDSNGGGNCNILLFNLFNIASCVIAALLSKKTNSLLAFLPLFLG